MVKSCYMIVAGKNVTADSSVMVARSCDGGGDYAQQIHTVPRKQHEPGTILKFKSPWADIITEIPQNSETYAHISVLDASEGRRWQTNGGINEFQVSAGASTGGPLNDKAAKVSPTMLTCIGDHRMRLILERCKTAKEGIKFLGELAQQYGTRIDNYIVADPNEAWLYEEYHDHLWAAVRVPDDCFLVEANTFRIEDVNLNDPDNFMGAKNLKTFAIENELYNPDSGEPFSAMKAYGRQYGKMSHGIPIPNYDRRRIWRGISLLAPSTNLDPEEPTFRYPLFVKPDKKLTPKDLLAVLADRYQGTKYNHYTLNRRKYRPATTILNANKVGEPAEIIEESPFRLNDQFQYQLSPNWGIERVIGISRSMTNWCTQLRGWMPNPIGGLMWTGLATAETTAHIPFYVGNTRTPKPYRTGTNKKHPAEKPFEASTFDENSAYWVFRVLGDLVDLFYEATKETVIPIWRNWEDKLYQLQPTIEKVAMELYKENPKLATEYLTMYSCDRAKEALEMAKEMTKKVFTIIAHYNSTSILGKGPL